MPDPANTGARVLAALEAGRAAQNERARQLRAPIVRAVRRELDHDSLANKPARGRAGRIARRLNLHPKRVQRILDSLFRVSNSICFNPSNEQREDG